MSESRSAVGGRNRVFAVGLVVLVMASLTYWTWPRPAVVITIAPGGVATVDGSALPETLFVKARGRSTMVRVVNGDTIRHQMALFGADAGETKDYTIAYPGTYGGVCSTHSSGNLTYVVQ